MDLIPLLEEDQLMSLGVVRMGQRVVLKNYYRRRKSKFYTALCSLCLSSGHKEVNCDLQIVFISGSSCKLSSHSGGIQSTIAKASKLIQELSTNPITQTERYEKKKRKRDFSRQFQ